ncbi:MAG: hypothetical protein S4CHLAM7_02680 [Chlamydiae bacterium]|nr:hypothetical protein [Chlamydiota bacterium]
MIGIFLDIESNGLDIQKHRAIEIALKFIDLSSKKEIDSYESIIYQPPEVWELSDPNSLKVNGFTYEKIAHGPTEEQVTKEILNLFKMHQIHRNCAVYICQNPSFDRSFFAQLVTPKLQEEKLWPYHWLDLASMFWALQLKAHQLKEEAPPWEIGISKNKIAHFLGLGEEKMPHKAMQGVEHLVECYLQLNTCHQP